MQFKLAIFIWLGYLFTSAYANENSSVPIQQLLNCQNVPAALERLSCYDSVLSPAQLKTEDSKTQESNREVWNKAMAHEAKRTDFSVNFMTTITEGSNPTILITTPALGYATPRPVLMFSCVENITRLQVALPKAIKLGVIDVRLETDNIVFNSSWFVREDGFLLEASRGLAGIQEIQKLFGAKNLKIRVSTAESIPLTFNIENLADEIIPLKKACHW